MPRHFSEDEKQDIRKRILCEGKALFEANGLKKTSVDQIVEVVGIAKGSFYNFYPSKESMAFDLLMSLEELMHEAEMSCLEKALQQQQFPEALSRTILYSLEKIESEPLLLTTVDAELVQSIWAKLSQDEKERSFAQDKKKVVDFIEAAQKCGYSLSRTPEIFQASLNCFFFAYINRHIVGNEGRDAMELIISSTIDRLFIFKT